jgi:hypothetical protein
MNVLQMLFDEIQQGLADIDSIQYCGALPKRRDDIRLPAILIDCVELEPDDDSGTEALGLISHWEARILVSEHMVEADLWALVQVAMLWLFNHSWSETNIGQARLKQAAPDYFSPQYQGHNLWLIEWAQRIRVGENIWDGSMVIPSVVSIGGLDAQRQEQRLTQPEE